MKNKLDLITFPRLIHLPGSNIVDTDDLSINKIEYEKFYIFEKVDGANARMGFSEDGPILGNREHILKKGYIKKDTPAKLQFRPAWNYLHSKEKEFIQINKHFNEVCLIFGEWMWVKHSLFYDKLKTPFIVYDMYKTETRKWADINEIEFCVKKLGTKSTYIELTDIKNALIISKEKDSYYRTGKMEGIVLRPINDFSKRFKYVNDFFQRNENFQDELVRNKLIT